MTDTRLFKGPVGRKTVIPVLLGVLIATTSPVVGPSHAQDVSRKVDGLIEEILESEVELRVPLRRSKIVRMKKDIFRAAIADPSLVEIVAFGSREIEIIGKDTGSTSLTLWMGTHQDASILSVLVTVTRDEEVDTRRRLEYGELQQMINEMFPDSKIQLVPIADKLIVRGEARDEQDAVRIMSVVSNRFSGNTFGNNDTSGIVQGVAASPFPDAGELPTSNVISLISVPGVKQVMLKVRIAELNRSAVRRLGVDFDFAVDDFFFQSRLGQAAGSLFLTGTFNEDSFNLALDALAGTSYAKILAEPNLVVLSGQKASFLSGGQFAVPTVVGVGGAQAATTTFKGYGTYVDFTPTVLDKDRIRLVVQSTFSTLNPENSVQGIPGLNTRTVDTVVELREGQVLSIAGLLQEQQRGDETRVPLLGDVKWLRPFFQSKGISRDETELIVLVSPKLVHPVEPENAPAILPGMEVTESDDIEFFLRGRIEGDPCCHHRSTVWPLYRDRMQKSRKYENGRPSKAYYLNGPHGFSE